MFHWWPAVGLGVVSDNFRPVALVNLERTWKSDKCARMRIFPQTSYRILIGNGYRNLNLSDHLLGISPVPTSSSRSWTLFNTSTANETACLTTSGLISFIAEWTRLSSNSDILNRLFKPHLTKWSCTNSGINDSTWYRRKILLNNFIAAKSWSGENKNKCTYTGNKVHDWEKASSRSHKKAAVPCLTCMFQARVH